jgi:hypothetical protein
MTNIDDTYIDDGPGIEAEAEHRPLPDAAYDDLLALVRLTKDATAWELRLAAGRRQAKQNRAEKKAIAAERLALDEYKAKTESEFEQERKAAYRRLYNVQRAEAALEEREQACRTREKSLGLAVTAHHDFTPIAGTTITREPERPRVTRTGTDGAPFADGTTITREPDPSAGTRVRPGRKSAPPPGPAT